VRPLLCRIRLDSDSCSSRVVVELKLTMRSVSLVELLCLVLFTLMVHSYN